MRVAHPAVPCVLVLSLLVGLVPAQESGKTELRVGTVISGGRWQPEQTTTPPKRPQGVAQVLPRIPLHVPIGRNNLPQPTSRPGTLFDPRRPPEGPCDFRYFINQPVQPTGAIRSTVGEPSASLSRDTALYTANWYAALSPDSGMSWTYINPATNFPNSDGGFCCDQRTIYVPSHDITIWLLQYVYSAATRQGRMRIAVANGRDGVRNNQWQNWWDFVPRSFGRPSREWMDFPDIAVSRNNLYVSANVFNAANQNRDAVVWRMNLSALKRGGTITYWWGRRTLGLGSTGAYRLTQNAGTTMYFASHNSTAQMRVYAVSDYSASVVWVDRNIPVWIGGRLRAPSPTGVNWAGRADGRILLGYRSGGEFGFGWNCAPMIGRLQCFVRIVRFDTLARKLIDAQDVFNPQIAVLYPAAAVNYRGDKGVVLAIGSATIHPSSVAMLVDPCAPTWHSQIWYFMRRGNASPGVGRWGDYFTVMRHPVLPHTFIGTGMTQIGGPANPNSEHRYAWFGRELYGPRWVNLSVSSYPASRLDITVDETDVQQRKNGKTPFTRSYSPHQGYTLTAPHTYTSGRSLYVFDHWVSKGLRRPKDERKLVVSDMGTGSNTARANYVITRKLTVQSTNPASGVSITVSKADINGAQDGNTAFERIYKRNTLLTLTAPATVGDNPFKRWVVNNGGRPAGKQSLILRTGQDYTAVAEYIDHVHGSFSTYGRGCPGTRGRVPTLAGSGHPDVGSVISLDVANARSSAKGFLLLGLGKVSVDLGIIGMPGCTMLVSGVANLQFTTNRSGIAQVPLFLNLDKSLIGTHFYLQAALPDPGTATPTKVTVTNGLDVTLGGDR